jgi:hypothetical protein
MLSRARASRLKIQVLVLTVGIFAATPILAQQASTGDLPNAPATNPETPPAVKTTRPIAQVPSQHRFWDRTNILLFSGIVVTRGMDYASTRNFQARGRQEALIPDDVVNNSAGFAALEAAGAATSVGISYILHRTGHHKMERWMSIGHICVTGFGDVRNYSLESSHPH